MEDNKDNVQGLTLEEQLTVLPALIRERNRLQEIYDDYEKRGKFSYCAIYADEINILKKAIKKIGGVTNDTEN